MIDRRLQTLRAVHQYGTVTAAAHALHLTPSAASQQIRQLSAHLGVALLEPEGRKVRLTDAALTLIAHADALFERWEEARADLAAQAGSPTGILRIGGFPTAIADLIAPAAAHLRKTAPKLTLRISEVETVEGYDLLLTNQLDIAVTAPTLDSPSPNDPRFAQQSLLDDELQHLLIPAGHHLANRRTVALAEAAHEPWIVPAAGTSDWHNITLVACASAGFTPAIAHHVKEWTAISALVAQGLGVALIPRLAHVPLHPTVALIPISDQPRPTRRILTCTRRGSHHHPAIQQGLNALQSSAVPAQLP